MTMKTPKRTQVIRYALPLAMFALALAMVPVRSAFAAATITIINNDGAGEGFNDPTPAAPIGGNSGTTVGQQRLIVFQTAANVWGSILTSPVVIRVRSNFDPLTCTATGAVLGSAGPISADIDFPGAPVSSTWYVAALADKLSGTNRDPANDDISARFNSNLGQANCLTGRFWYYGLDGNEGNNVDLLPVILHELGHGLGFLTLANSSSGALFNGSPDAFLRFLFDNSTGLHWSEMTNSQRAASAINTGHLVWDGPAVTFKAPLVLAKNPEMIVNAPASIAGTYTIGTATFGGALTAGGLSGNVVLVDDGLAPNSDACSALINGGAVSGKIALLDRGVCGFSMKAKFAQDAGAIAVIIANNVAGGPPGLGGTDPSVVIPVVSVSLADGNTLKAHLAESENVTLRLNPTQLAGADAAHRMRMYDPNPIQPGSSVSHWDVSATPNLLMEPAINPDLTASVDLTREAFEDIGWFAHTTAVGDPLPLAARLVGNTPNPFHASTSIEFAIARDENTDLAIYDLNGRMVKRLVQSRLAAGTHTIAWDGTDGNGRAMAPGVYLYRLRAGTLQQSRHMALVR